jgi:RNA recognition motif-containing protein
MNIYVGNLPYNIAERDLKTAFEQFGKVSSVEIIMDRRTNRSRGYGFVEMPNDKEAMAAINKLNGNDFHGRRLRVDASQPKTERRRGRFESRDTRSAARPSQPMVAPLRYGGPVQPHPQPQQKGFMAFLKRLFGGNG